MSAIDVLIVVAIMGLFLIVGLTGGSKSDSPADYFLAGRNLRWHQIGFSLFATNFSASALIGITGAAYVIGIAIYNYEWVGSLVLIFFALVMVQVIRRSRVYTIAEYLALRYDDRVRTIYSAFIILLFVFIEMAGSLYAGGLLLEAFLPGLSSTAIIVITMVIVGLYSIFGGLSAISRTDVLQSIVLIFGAVAVTVFTYDAVGGWDAFVASAPARSLDLVRPIDDRGVPWTGLIVGVPLIGAYFWLVNQQMVQWVLSARSETHARRGLIFAGFLKVSSLFLIVLPGIAATILIPGLDQPDHVYPALLMELMPIGVLGFVLAGFAAALMSNVDSTLHAASTLLTMDFIKRWRPDLSSKQLVMIGRWASVIIIVISAIWAPMIGNFGTLFEYIQGLLAYTVSPFVVVYVGGMFWSRGTSRAAILALLVGMASGAVIAIVSQTALPDLHYLHVTPIIAIISASLYVLASLSEPDPRVADDLIWSRVTLSEILLGDRVMASLLAGLLVLTLIVFW